MIKFYQTILELGIKGRFNTPEEFDKIGMPKDLNGWTVLDIGCNIGAFMIEACKRGAYWVEGIETNKVWKLIANGIFYELELFRKCRAGEIYETDVHGNNADLVLLLSVLHVTENPQKLLDDAWKMTKKLLIVEINDRLQKEPIKLPKGAKFYGKNKDNRSVYHCLKV